MPRLRYILLVALLAYLATGLAQVRPEERAVVRRFSYPEAVRDSIHARIRSERDRKVAEYQAKARQQAAEIVADADRAARTVEADARARKTVIEGEAAAEAGRVRSAAYAQDREFYVFLEKLRSFQAMLADTRDVLLLSTKHPLFDLLRGPPAPMPKTP